MRRRLAGGQTLPATSTIGAHRRPRARRLAALAKCLPARMAANLLRRRLAGRQRLPAASRCGPHRPSGSHRLAALAKCPPARLAADLVGRRLAGKRGLQMRRVRAQRGFAAAPHRLASEWPGGIAPAETANLGCRAGGANDPQVTRRTRRGFAPAGLRVHRSARGRVRQAVGGANCRQAAQR